MINIIEKQCLTERQPQKFDPISFYVWQILITQASLFIQYIFRAVRLIEISNHNQISLELLPNYLKQTLQIPAGHSNDLVEKIIQKLEELLDLKISEPNYHQEKAAELKEIVDKEYDKFSNAQNSLLESFSQQKIHLDSSRNLQTQSKFDKHSSNQIKSNEKSFLQDLQYIENQERKLSFKEMVAKPTQPFYQKLSKTQTNILNKINKIASFQDIQFQKVQKIKSIENTILDNLQTNFEKLHNSALKFKQLKHQYKSKLVLKPIQESQKSSEQIKSGTLTKLIKNKIFATQIHKSYLLKKDSSSQNQIIKSNSQKKIEQTIKANYLSNEKLEKIKLIQNYFRKYLNQKKKQKVPYIIAQNTQKKSHYFKLDVNKIRSRSNYSNISQSSRIKPVCTIVKINKEHLQSFLKRQESQGKKGYQDKLQFAKQKKIYQAIEKQDSSIIQSSGFIYCSEDFNFKDEQQNTPLYYSAKNNVVILSRFLLQKGANPNIKCSKGQTPTHMACLTQNPEMFKLFSFFGADFNMPDEEGITPQTIYKSQVSIKMNQIPFTSPKFDEFLIL